MRDTADGASLVAANLNDEINLPEGEESLPLLRVRTLCRVKILWSSFRRANFSDAQAAFMEARLTDFTGADFGRAHCINVSFEHCSLASADFAYANCEGADFSRAGLDGADLSGVNLLHAKGLTLEKLRWAKTI